MRKAALRVKGKSDLIPLTSDTFTIGRALDNSYIIEDICISRKHFALHNKSDEWFICDMSSSGTWLNDYLIKQGEFVQLADGDRIRIGLKNELIFKVINNFSKRKDIEESAHDAAEAFASADAFDGFMDCSVTSEQPAEVLDNLLGCNELVVVTEPATVSNPPVATTAENASQKSCSSGAVPAASIETAEDELQCSICTEMFVKAVTLNCSHTFCSYCIKQWRQGNSDCPICRTTIKTMNPTLVLDSYIEKVTKNASDELQAHRKELAAQRASASVRETPSTSKTASILVSSSSESEPSDDEDGMYSDYTTADWDYYDSDHGSSRPYYGGYGRCYSCGRRGHWSNGCPFKSNR